MPVNLTITEDAQAALDLLRERGWIQGKSCASEGICLGEAIYRQAHYYDLAWMVRAQIVMGPGAVNPYTDIQRWNDMPGRTEAEVHDLLKNVGAK